MAWELEDKLIYNFGRLMIFFKGGMTFSDLNDMPLVTLCEFIEVANKISGEMERESKK